MAYNSNIPQASDRINISQGQILGNFQAIPVLLAVNHASFGDPDEGKHKFITFPQLPTGSIAVPAAPAGNDINIYSSAVAGTAQLHIQRSAGTAIPFTRSNQGGVAGWTYLPSGMKIVWGSATVPGGSASVVVLFSSVALFPGFTGGTNPTVQITRARSGTSNNFITIQETAISNTQFTAFKSGGSSSSADIFLWMAIGM